MYSLGVLLYELLTGTTPIERQRFKQAALLEMLRVVREEEPPRPSTRLSSTETKASIAEKRGTEPSRLTKELRTELDWVVMKSLEKDRVRRYATAVNFAEDVQRYLSGEAVQAHPPSASYRIRKFARKHRGPVIAASLILLALIGGAAGAVYGVIKADGEREAIRLRSQAELDRDDAKTARGKAEEAKGEAEKARGETEKARAGEKDALQKLAVINYGRTVQLAYLAWREHNIVRALELLNGTRPDLRGWEWDYVRKLCGNEVAFDDETESIYAVHVVPEGIRAVVGSDKNGGETWICDVPSRNKLVRVQGASGLATFFSFGPNGTRLLGRMEKGREVLVWDVRTGAKISTLRGHTGEIRSAAFSRDGERVITTSEDATVRVWDAGTGGQLAAFQGTQGVAVGNLKPRRVTIRYSLLGGRCPLLGRRERFLEV